MPAAIAAAATPPPRIEVTVRIQKAQRVTSEEWQRAGRQREIIVREDGRVLIVRLIELE